MEDDGQDISLDVHQEYCQNLRRSLSSNSKQDGNQEEDDDDFRDSHLRIERDLFSPNKPPLRTDNSTNYPFKKWVNSFRSRRRVAHQIPPVYVDGWFDEPSMVPDETPISTSPPTVQKPWDQMSGGSSSILGTVKTASMSMATASVVRSRTNTLTSHRSASVSSPIPSFETRRSLDSVNLTKNLSMDNAIRCRAVKRRHVLQEICVSESNYVHGLQTLVQLLSTYLTTRPAILRDVQNLQHMHETFKTQLQAVSPLSTEPFEMDTEADPTVSQKVDSWSKYPSRFSKSQNRSLRTRKFKGIFDCRFSRTAADPGEALKVAREIEKLSEGFGTYEDFCGRYDLLEGDLGVLRKLLPADGFWAEGIEALAKSVDSVRSRKSDGKRSMTVDDLIVKPVQRVCKYPLLLSELLKTVPESDCPSSHLEIRQILEKIRLVVGRINTATGNPALKGRIQKTISLHERCDYNGQTVLSNVYQQLGPLNVCGALHVAYQSKDRIVGEYMVCVLFPSYLVLARPAYDPRKVTVVASLYVLDTTIDILSNGQGLICHHTPYSWKVIFQDDHNRYELILSASSALEERGWKTELLKASAVSPNDLPTLSLEPRKFFVLSLPLVPIDRVDSRSTAVGRRSSVRSSSSPSIVKRQTEQVIIKKTHNPMYDEDVRHLQETGISRSRSVVKEMTPTILSPLRQDRVRLERIIADIFTRDVLPFPGMIMGRADYLRTQSLMRGLSFRTPFNSRRSTSISKVTVDSVDSGSDTREANSSVEKDAEGNRSLQSSIHQFGEMDRNQFGPNQPSDSMRSASTKVFLSMRQRLVRASSDNVTGNSTPSMPMPKPRPSMPWKRWTSPLAFFSNLSASRNSNSDR